MIVSAIGAGAAGSAACGFADTALGTAATFTPTTTGAASTARSSITSTRHTGGVNNFTITSTHTTCASAGLPHRPHAHATSASARATAVFPTINGTSVCM